MNTVQCPGCKNDVNVDFIACPHCDTIIKGHSDINIPDNQQRTKSIALGVICTILAVICILWLTKPNNFVDHKLTKAVFERISIGMTYGEVRKAIGEPGELLATAGEGEYKTDIYMWYGNGNAGANANFTFQNGKLTAKAQFGLK